MPAAPIRWPPPTARWRPPRPACPRRARRAPGQECACDARLHHRHLPGGRLLFGRRLRRQAPVGRHLRRSRRLRVGRSAADGVCCNVACTGACVSCNQPDHMGECAPVAAGRRRSPRRLPRGRARDLRSKRLLQRPGRLRQVRARARCASWAAARGGTSSSRPACATARAPASWASPCPARRRPAQDGTCITACTDSSQCLSPAVCAGGSCGKRGNGQDCTSADQCGTGFCVEGVCCESACAGACQTCALPSARGKCTPGPGQRRRSRGACARTAGPPPAATTASATARAPARSTRTAPSARRPAATPTPTPRPRRAPARAGAASVPGGAQLRPPPGLQRQPLRHQLRQRLAVHSGNVCVDGRLRQAAQTGATCSSGGQCASGNCAQGRCCATACNGSCKSCALPGQEGTCANVPAGGADPTGTCSDGACTNGCDGERRLPARAGQLVVRQCPLRTTAAASCASATPAAPASTSPRAARPARPTAPAPASAGATTAPPATARRPARSA